MSSPLKFKLSALALSATVLLTGCSSSRDATQTPVQVEDRTLSSRTQTQTPSSTSATTNGASSMTNIAPTAIAPAINATSALGGRGDPALRDPKSLLSQRNIFFDYDAFVVAPEYRALIEAHAKYLSSNRGMRMRVEGNTDERGSREYNLALGQRRADAVRRALVVLGVSEGQIETVSFGEEKPRATGLDEAALRENRRADIVYSGE